MSGVDVTVVIPTFRRPEQLRQAALSALAQEGASIEVVVIDDSPEGSGREAAESIGDRRVVYKKRPTPSNGRPALARNDAWPHARGRYVHFLDDDDLVLPGTYQAHLAALDATANAGIGMSFGRIDPFGTDPEAVRHEARFWNQAAARARSASRLGRFAFVATMLFDGAVLQNSACLVRKSLLREIGGFDPLMPLQEDTEMHARGTRVRGCVFLDRPVVRYRVSSTSLMRTGDMVSLLDESYARMQRKYRERYGLAEFLALKVYARSRAAIGRPFG